MAKRSTFLDAIAKLSLHRQSALQIFKGLLVFAELFVTIADQPKCDGFAFSISLAAKERENLLKFGQRGSCTFLGIELSRVGQDVAGLLRLGRGDRWHLGWRQTIDGE